MPRFIHGDDWWEIERDGANLVITAGTRGGPSKEQLRRYKTPGHAEVQYDVMIRDKVAAGYELTTTPVPVLPVDAADDPARTELEAAITADPYGTSVYAVYGDWLQSHGDPRGELIALQLAEDARPGDPKLVAAIGRHLEKHRPVLLGPLARHVAKIREFTEGVFVWRFGVIHIVQLDRDATGEPIAPILDEVLHHPSGKFVAEISLKLDPKPEVAAVLALLARDPSPSLRAFELATTADCGDLGPFLRAHPKLRRLAIRGRVGMTDLSPMHETLRSIVTASLPELEELELRLLNRDIVFSHLRPLLRRGDLPALRRLRLRSADYPDEIIAELVESPLAAQLTVLDLGLAEVGDPLVRRLLNHQPRFPELAEVVVMRGFLSRSVLGELQAMVKKVTFVDEDPDDEDRMADGEYFDGVEE